MLKVLQSSIFRALCAVAVGALLIRFPEDTKTYFVRLIGLLFLIPGIISCLTYLYMARKADRQTVYDENGNVLRISKPTFPIVGIGSMALGAMLVICPQAFIPFLVYLIGGILVLGALAQIIHLISLWKYGRYSFLFWICPFVVLLVAAWVIYRAVTVTPDSVNLIPTDLYAILGWTLMLYGITEALNSLKGHRMRKAFESKEKLDRQEDKPLLTESQEGGSL